MKKLITFLLVSGKEIEIIATDPGDWFMREIFRVGYLEVIDVEGVRHVVNKQNLEAISSTNLILDMKPTTPTKKKRATGAK